MKKGNFFKLFLAVLCLCGAVLFAAVQSGMNVPFLHTYSVNFKQNIIGICNTLHIPLPVELQLYLSDTSVPEPKPTMMPATEQEALEKALGYSEQEEVVPQEGTAELTTKEAVTYSSNDARPIAFDAAENAMYAEYNDSILAVSETHYQAYSKGGKLLWDIPIQMQSPSLVVRGKYVLINERGSKKVSLYKGKNELFTIKTPENIITADLSPKGDIVAITDKEHFKGQVMVINKSGQTIFAWDSGSYNILDAAISKDRRVSVSLLNTDSGADSFITCFGVDGKTKFKTDNFENSLIFDLEYIGDRLNAIADNRSLGLNKKGKILWDYDFSGKTLQNYAIAKNGSKFLLFKSGGSGEIIILSAGGKVYSPIVPETIPDAVSIKSDYIAYNSGRDVIITDFKGKKFLKATCDSNIKQLFAIGPKNVFCVYSSSIQFKKLAKQEKHDTVTAQ